MENIESRCTDIRAWLGSKIIQWGNESLLINHTLKYSYPHEKKINFVFHTVCFATMVWVDHLWGDLAENYCYNFELSSDCLGKTEQVLTIN